MTNEQEQAVERLGRPGIMDTLDVDTVLALVREQEQRLDAVVAECDKWMGVVAVPPGQVAPDGRSFLLRTRRITRPATEFMREAVKDIRDIATGDETPEPTVAMVRESELQAAERKLAAVRQVGYGPRIVVKKILDGEWNLGPAGEILFKNTQQESAEKRQARRDADVGKEAERKLAAVREWSRSPYDSDMWKRFYAILDGDTPEPRDDRNDVKAPSDDAALEIVATYLDNTGLSGYAASVRGAKRSDTDSLRGFTEGAVSMMQRRMTALENSLDVLHNVVVRVRVLGGGVGVEDGAVKGDELEDQYTGPADPLAAE